MPLSKKQQFKRKAERSFLELDKMSKKKVEKKLIKTFKSLNNKKCYDFFQVEEHKTFHNLLDFLYIFERYLKNKYGKSKKYGKKKTEKALADLIPAPTKRQVKTINEIKKAIKKPKSKKLVGFKFKFGKKTKFGDMDKYFK